MTALLADLGVALPVDDGVAAHDLLDLAVLAEQLGFGTVMAGEVRGPDVFALLGAVAARTQRVTIGTAVVGIRTRSIPLTAMAFDALSSLAPGRVVAGVGVSSRQIIEQWHGRTFPAPLDQVRGAVPDLQALLAGRAVEVSEGVRFRLPHPVGEPVPVLVGALNPRARRLAGQVADGVVLAWSGVEETAAAVAEVRAAAGEAGRPPTAVTVAAAVFAHAGHDAETATADVADRIIQYSLSSGHRAQMQDHVAEIDRAAQIWADGDRERARATVPAPAIDEHAIIGSAAAVAGRLQEFRDVGVDLPLLYPLAARRPGSAAMTISAVADAVKGSR